MKYSVLRKEHRDMVIHLHMPALIRLHGTASHVTSSFSLSANLSEVASGVEPDEHAEKSGETEATNTFKIELSELIQDLE